MINNNLRLRQLFKPVGSVFGSLFLLAICIKFISCSYQSAVDKTTKTVRKTTRKITRGITFSGDELKKMVGVVGFENKSGYRNQDFQNFFQKGLPEYLNNQCKGIIVENYDPSWHPDHFKELPRLSSGRIDNFALANIGRQLGLNAIVTGNMYDISLIDEVRGMLWTKDTHHLIRLLVGVEVYDSQTGTKILDESFSRKVGIDEIDYELIQDNEQFNLPELNETLTELLADMGDSICWAFGDQPWNGFIISIVGDKITLSSGSRVGLEPGILLEVYDTSRTIEGVDGQRFFAPGNKIGEIKIVAVDPDKSEAIVVSGNGIKAGSSVRLK